MADESRPIHYVSTHEEAREIARARSDFWVSNCGCRELRGSCGRSRTDLCLMFVDMQPSGTGKKKISREEMEEIFREAERARLVARPFRNEARTGTDGICFCCDDCCGYFLNPAEICDKGRFIERTDETACSQCGVCADACYFGARTMADGSLSVVREKCYGCGLCASVCPEDCINMTLR